MIIILGTGSMLAEETFVFTDSQGLKVEIETPVERIVCISSALNEILVALDAGELVIGRDEWSDVPSALDPLQEVPVVAPNSFRPQIEAIVEMQPDIVIGDNMLQDDARKKFESFGISTMAGRTSDPEDLFDVIENLGRIVDREDRAEEIIQFIAHCRDIINERVAQVEEDEKPALYWERRGKYKTASSIIHPRIIMAGAKNIAADTEGRYPDISSEYVIQADPEVIIRIESRGTSIDSMKDRYQEVVNRSGLKDTQAVKNNRVYILSWAVNSGLPSVVGDLYYAKFSHPDLFDDLEPMDVYRELMGRFFGIEPDVQLIYPANY